jgi:hypothetical protein
LCGAIRPGSGLALDSDAANGRRQRARREVAVALG